MISENSQTSSGTANNRARLVYDVSVIIAKAQLLATPTVLFTVPAQSTWIMKNFAFFNTDSSDRTATLRLVPSGESIADDAHTYWEQICKARGSYYWDNEAILPAGYQVVAYADSANLVNITITGTVVASK